MISLLRHFIWKLTVPPRPNLTHQRRETLNGRFLVRGFFYGYVNQWTHSLSSPRILPVFFPTCPKFVVRQSLPLSTPPLFTSTLPVSIAPLPPESFAHSKPRATRRVLKPLFYLFVRSLVAGYTAMGSNPSESDASGKYRSSLSNVLHLIYDVLDEVACCAYFGSVYRLESCLIVSINGYCVGYLRYGHRDVKSPYQL
jgi:hypothetical protein